MVRVKLETCGHDKETELVLINMFNPIFVPDLATLA